MNFFAEFHELIAAILSRIAAQGRLPENLDLQRFAVEPPRDPAHGDLSTNAAMVYAREAKKFFANPRQVAVEIAAALSDSPLRSRRRVLGLSDRLEKLRANPAADWRISDIEAVCREHGVFCAPPRGGGSHYKIGHPAMAEKLTIPFNRPIKPIYIRKLVAFLDAVRARK